MTDNPNYPNDNGDSPIYLTARDGHTEIVKILVPLTNNPNAPNRYGKTPIHWAARFGYTEMVKILAPLTDNPNAPNEWGHTSSTWQKFMGMHFEIEKIFTEILHNAPKQHQTLI